MRRVQKKLAKRLALAALLVAVTLGSLVFFYEMERVDDAVVAMAVRESNVFKRNIGSTVTIEHMNDHDTMKKLLVNFVHSRAAAGHGHYVSVELYGPNKEKVADADADGYEKVKIVIDKINHNFEPDNVWYDRSRIDGEYYVLAMIPLRNADDSLIGYFEGTYHIPAETLADIHDTVASAIVIVIGVVLLTTLMLYPIIIALNRDLMVQSRNMLQANLQTLEALGGAIAKRDSDTHAHNFRVCVYSIRLAEEIGFSPEAICNLLKGALLHDVGKIAIPDAILLKPGKLTVDEFEVMKSHVPHGLDIIKHSAWLTDAADVVRFHHEKFNGEGYMSGIAGEAIPIAARVFAIADVFDALTSRRPYKGPMSFEMAMAILHKDSGSHFDPRLVEAFTSIAKNLHDRFGGQDDNEAERELQILTAKYFGLDESLLLQ